MNIDLVLDAIRMNQKEEVFSLLNSYPELLNQTDSRSSTPLLLASYYDRVDTVSFLLRQGADTEIEDHSGNTALMGACFKGHKNIVQHLLANGANVNFQNKEGLTALMFAVLFQQEPIVKLLLQNNADVQLKDHKGLTAYDHAKQQDATKITALLANSE